VGVISSLLLFHVNGFVGSFVVEQLLTGVHPKQVRLGRFKRH
jgi:hypothetical protein